MSTVERAQRTTLPPLEPGQRLDQPTFHDRYEAMPPNIKAELVEGIVYMPSPTRGDHGGTSQITAGWLLHYRWNTPRVAGEDGCTVKLDFNGEPQPDHMLRPGLWLDPAALYSQDLDRLIQVLEQGLATTQHAAFVAKLAAAAAGRKTS